MQRGRLPADLADHADERGGAVVGEVVAVDAGDDRVAQAHLGDAARDAGGLERVVPRRLAGLDVAEAAAPRARVAEDHERRGSALPALADVGAGGLLADRVQVLGFDQRLELAVALAAGRRHLEPRRLARRGADNVRAEALSTFAIPPGLARDRVACSRVRSCGSRGRRSRDLVQAVTARGTAYSSRFHAALGPCCCAAIPEAAARATSLATGSCATSWQRVATSVADRTHFPGGAIATSRGITVLERGRRGMAENEG